MLVGSKDFHKFKQYYPLSLQKQTLTFGEYISSIDGWVKRPCTIVTDEIKLKQIPISSLLKICPKAKLIDPYAMRNNEDQRGSVNSWLELTAKKVLFKASTSHVLIDKQSM